MNKGLKSAGALALLLAVLGASYGAEQWRLSRGKGVEIPVVRVEETLVTSAGAMDAIETYRRRREEQREKDLDALTRMIQGEHTTPQAREDAQAELLRITREGEMETALEGAMTAAGFSPCLCALEGEVLTLMVGQTELSQGKASLLMTLAQRHTRLAAENILILTGESF